MISFRQYVQASSLEEAYTLNQKRSSIVIGGMLWTKLSRRKYATAIGLEKLGLDTIEETEEAYSIGCMVTLRTLETHEGLLKFTGGAMKNAVEHIVGVQFRNNATVGGSLWGRFGYSDVLTIFLALDASVELYHAGVMKLSEFVTMSRRTRDILVRVIVPKTTEKIVYLSQRNTQTDFPVLAVCIAKGENGMLCSIGARPSAAVAMEITDTQTPEEIADLFTYGSNIRASKEYRKRIAEVLIRRGLAKLQEV